jgi:hypothetical protein
MQLLLTYIPLAIGQLAIASAAQSSSTSLPVTATATQSVLSEATSALAAAKSNSPTSSNGIASVFQYLFGSIDTLGAVIAKATAQAEEQFLKLVDPELFYSYGGSPPVYPTRKLLYPLASQFEK